MTWIFTDHEDLAMATYDFALVAHLLDRRTYLHVYFLSAFLQFPYLTRPAAADVSLFRYRRPRTFDANASTVVRACNDGLFETIRDATAIEVVHGKLDCYLVAGKNLDVVHPHLRICR